MTEGSIAFDRAAEFYDRTRFIDDAAMARNVELLGGELRDRGRVLEVGVGTGLIALPLHAAGVDVHGLDLSPPMVAKIAEKAGGTSPFPVVLADATRQPFADDAFGGSYLRWVLHLVPNWRDVLAEVARVVSRGGVFLANLGAYGGPRRDIQERFAEITGISIAPVGLAWGATDQLDAAMSELGASVRELDPVDEGGEEALRAFLDEVREGLFSWTWILPQDVRDRAVAELEPWAEERWGDLDEVRPFHHATVWRAYDLP
jgi:SAM-dependent methyltransferase